MTCSLDFSMVGVAVNGPGKMRPRVALSKPKYLGGVCSNNSCHDTSLRGVCSNNSCHSFDR
jgi:hypothetical protein